MKLLTKADKNSFCRTQDEKWTKAKEMYIRPAIGNTLIAGMCHCQMSKVYVCPRNISSLLDGAFGERKSGIVVDVRLGLCKNSTGHSVSLCSFICT